MKLISSNVTHYRGSRLVTGVITIDCWNKLLRLKRDVGIIDVRILIMRQMHEDLL